MQPNAPGLLALANRHTWLYTEMVVDQSVIHNTDYMLKYNQAEHPVVVQLGGSDAPALRLAAEHCVQYGYDEINLNCGCPSDRVQDGCFGAVLMKTPSLVAECMNAIHDSAGPAGVPVTVKCRIGVDDCDSYEELQEFVRTISEAAPVGHFLIHARKAFLQGLNPAQNRSIPPLHYDVVYRLVQDFPHLKFSLNGGVQSLEEAAEHIAKGVHGVMIGRMVRGKSPYPYIYV
jgi:tRNA-dihydrouridine synthase A